MPNLHDIDKRIKSVSSTKQITRTMEMVAGAKVKHATERIAAAGLAVSQRLDTRPQHPKSRDAANPLAAARLHETVSLYILQPAAEAT